MTWQGFNPTSPASKESAPTNPAWKYRRHQVEEATPLQRVIMVYDVALRACTQRDLAKVTQALQVLDDALDFSQGEIAVQLSRLYQFCADAARRGAFDEAMTVLRELREAWVQASENLGGQQPSPALVPVSATSPTMRPTSASGHLITRSV